MPGRRLVVVSERDHNFIDLDRANMIRVGRAPDNDIVVKDDMVSRRHCQFEADANGKWRIRDLKSFNGTYLNEKRVRDEPLALWDAVRVGRTKMIVVDRLAELDADGEPEGDGLEPDTAAPAPAPEPEPAPAAPAEGEDPVAPGDMGATRTMDVSNAAAGELGQLLTNKDMRGLVEDIVRREREEIERQISRRIRDESGPSVLSSLHGFKVRVRRVGPVDGGGDFFDVFKNSLRPKDLSMCLGSVSGVGVAACVAATTARHTLRGSCTAPGNEEPQRVIEGLCEVLGKTLHPGSALSVLLAQLTDSGKVHMAAMGGTGAMLYNAATEQVDVLRPPGRRDEEAVRVQAMEVSIKDDDRLLLISDGGGAMRKGQSDPYGAPRLQGRLAELASQKIDPKELLAKLIDDYVEFSDGAPERDVTLMVLTRVAG